MLALKMATGRSERGERKGNSEVAKKASRVYHVYRVLYCAIEGCLVGIIGKLSAKKLFAIYTYTAFPPCHARTGTYIHLCPTIFTAHTIPLCCTVVYLIKRGKNSLNSW